MKLIIAIVNNDDSAAVVDELNRASFHVTKLATTGGFLRAGNTTLLTGVEDDKVEQAIGIIGKTGRERREYTTAVPHQYGDTLFPGAPIEVTVGGATVFVLNVEDFRKM